MKNVLRAIGRGFAGLLRFGGRDSRAGFWPYAGFVIVVVQVLGIAAMVPPMIGRIQRYALEHPEQTRVSSGPGHYSIEIKGNSPDMVPIMTEILAGTAIVAAVTVALLAAAVARRLHDRDRRGYWGLLPLPFLVAGLALMPKAFAGIAADPEVPDLSAFLALILNNFAYLGMLGILIVLLAGPGTPGPNRFGPPPA